MIDLGEIENRRRAFDFAIDNPSCEWLGLYGFSEDVLTHEYLLGAVRRNCQVVRLLHAENFTEEMREAVESHGKDWLLHVREELVTDDMLVRVAGDGRMCADSYRHLLRMWITRDDSGMGLKPRMVELATMFPEAVDKLAREMLGFTGNVCDTEVCLAAASRLESKLAVLQYARESLVTEINDAIRENHSELKKLMEYNYGLVEVALLKEVVGGNPSYLRYVPKHLLIRHFSDHPLFFMPCVQDAATYREVIVDALSSFNLCFVGGSKMDETLSACEDALDPELVVSVFGAEGCLHLLRGRGLDYLREKDPELADTFALM